MSSLLTLLSLGLPLHLSETNTPMSTSVASLSCLEGGSGESDGVVLFENKDKAGKRGGGGGGGGEIFQETEEKISQEKKMRS